VGNTGRLYPKLSNEKEDYLKKMAARETYYPNHIINPKRYFCDEMLARAFQISDYEAVKIIKSFIYAHITETCKTGAPNGTSNILTGDFGFEDYLSTLSAV